MKKKWRDKRQDKTKLGRPDVRWKKNWEMRHKTKKMGRRDARQKKCGDKMRDGKKREQITSPEKAEVLRDSMMTVGTKCCSDLDLVFVSLRCVWLSMSNIYGFVPRVGLVIALEIM